MATHSGILAWESLWTEEPGRLQPTGFAKESDTTERLNSNDSSPELGQPLEVYPAISSESLTALGTCHRACVPTAHGTILSFLFI